MSLAGNSIHNSTASSTTNSRRSEQTRTAIAVAKWFDSISDMASHALLQLQGRVIRLIETLSDSSVRSRLVWAYASICRADQRGYRRDDFRSLRTEARTVAMKKLVTEPDKDHQTEAAYYFNNALFRMVIVAEIGLKQLYRGREGLD